VNNYENSLKTVEELSQIIKTAPILRCCFLNPRTVVEEVKHVAEAKMLDSTNRLVDILLSPQTVAHFYPRQAILTQEKRKKSLH
jgi:hypothetical protein